VDNGVELFGQMRHEVVALPFCLRQIDHTDGAFQPWLGQSTGEGLVRA
jgi:hypothetical protein